jgi:hypothetical protein
MFLPGREAEGIGTDYLLMRNKRKSCTGVVQSAQKAKKHLKRKALSA